MRFLLPILAVAAACRKDEVPPRSGKDIIQGGQCPAADRTDTIPQFCGRVPRNLLFISIDTFRKDHLDRYSGGTPYEGMDITPWLTSLAAEGYALDDHTTCSNWTYAGTTCVALGRSHIDNGFIPKLSSRYREPMPDDTPMLAAWLADSGRYNILVSSNSWLGKKWNNDQGFDVTDAGGPRVAGVYDTVERYLVEAQMTGLAAQGWFVHMHVVDPHVPYNAPDLYSPDVAALPPSPIDASTYDLHYEALGQYHNLAEAEQALFQQHLEARYRGELRYTDDQLEDAWRSMDLQGWLDDTLVVVWTDHGEAFWTDHGRQTHAYYLFGEENDGIAFFWARNIVAGSWDGPTTATDLAPTILKLFGLPMPPEVTGFPIGEAPNDRLRFAMSYARLGVVQSVLRGDQRLQFRWTGKATFTDRSDTPPESDDTFDVDDPAVQDLWAHLRPEVEAADAIMPEKEVNWIPGLE